MCNICETNYGNASSLQSFAEAFRNGIARVAMILAAFITPIAMDYMTVIAALHPSSCLHPKLWHLREISLETS